MMRLQFEKKGDSEALAFLPQLRINMANAVMDTIPEHLAMYPLIDDLECTLFLNRTTEDFIACDHPIALGNNLPSAGRAGFSSRGLLIAIPLSSRSLILLSDRDVYKVVKNGSGVAFLTDYNDVVGLNLSQCSVAHENLYFSCQARVERTLLEFKAKKASLRQELPKLEEMTFESGDNTSVQFGMSDLLSVWFFRQ